MESQINSYRVTRKQYLLLLCDFMSENRRWISLWLPLLLMTSFIQPALLFLDCIDHLERSTNSFVADRLELLSVN